MTGYSKMMKLLVVSSETELGYSQTFLNKASFIFSNHLELKPALQNSKSSVRKSEGVGFSCYRKAQRDQMWNYFGVC